MFLFALQVLRKNYNDSPCLAITPTTFGPQTPAAGAEAATRLLIERQATAIRVASSLPTPQKIVSLQSGQASASKCRQVALSGDVRVHHYLLDDGEEGTQPVSVLSEESAVDGGFL
jgi:hypothetical protein